LDESVDPAVAMGLRRRGADVTTSQETGLLNAPDIKQIYFAIGSGRILVTHDDDFLALVKSGLQHSGIAFCHAQLRSIGQMIAGLMLIRDCLTTADMQNHIEFL
jgi:hypothetical protein